MSNEILAMFACEWDYCWSCGIAPGPDAHWFRNTANEPDYPRWLETHHIIRPGRVHARWNLARLCKLCHDIYHGAQVPMIVDGARIILPDLSLANVLWMKARHEERCYCRDLMRRQYGRFLPHAKRPPAWYIDAYANRRCHYPADVENTFYNY